MADLARIVLRFRARAFLYVRAHLTHGFPPCFDRLGAGLLRGMER